MKILNTIHNNGIKFFLNKIFIYPYIFYKRRIAKKYRNFKLYDRLPSIEEYNQKVDNRVVVSLTSFPKRFDQLVVTLKSILLQNVTPYKIVVYLGSDTKESDITTNMKELEKYGIIYKIDNKLNLKGHKKYFYALREFPDKLVITIDDDIIFPNTMISELVKCYEKHPNDVIARRIHKIIDKNGEILSYDNWDKEYPISNKSSNRFIATTGAGTLYSPNVIEKLTKDTFDSNKILELCLEADDIWMKCMEVISGIKVVLANIKYMGSFIDVNESDTLMSLNVGKGKNDIFFKQVCDYYKIDKKLFLKNK